MARPDKFFPREKVHGNVEGAHIGQIGMDGTIHEAVCEEDNDWHVKGIYMACCRIAPTPSILASVHDVNGFEKSACVNTDTFVSASSTH